MAQDRSRTLLTSARGRRSACSAATPTRPSRSTPRRSTTRRLPNDRRATILNDRGVAYSRAPATTRRRSTTSTGRSSSIRSTPPSTTIAATCCWRSARCARRSRTSTARCVLAPGYAAAYSNRAGAYMKLGQVDQAIADYTKAIELTPGSPAALSGRGRAHLAANRPHGGHPRFHARRQPRCALRRRLPQPRGSQAVDRALRRGDRGLQPRHRLRAAQRRALCAARAGLPGSRQRACRRQGFHARRSS